GARRPGDPGGPGTPRPGRRLPVRRRRRPPPALRCQGGPGRGPYRAATAPLGQPGTHLRTLPAGLLLVGGPAAAVAAQAGGQARHRDPPPAGAARPEPPRTP